MKLKNISEVDIPKEQDQRFSERYVGEVQSFHELTDIDQSGTRYIWNFRVIPQPADRSRLPVLDVEMKGQSFEGSLHDGDQVRLPKVPLGEGTIRISKLENLTYHTQVIARGNGFSDYVGLVIILGGLVSVIAALIIFSDTIFSN